MMSASTLQSSPHKKASASHVGSPTISTMGSRTAAIGFMLVVLKYWRNSNWEDGVPEVALQLRHYLRALPEILRPLAQTILQWVQHRIHRVLYLLDDKKEAAVSLAPNAETPNSYNGHHGHEREFTSLSIEENEPIAISVLHATDVDNEAVEIRENIKMIQKVLHYWFGQYSPDDSQKKLWMISASSSSHRKKVDKEITLEFGKILNDLAGGSHDRWSDWCEDTVYGYQGKIAAIVVLDQFSRHIHRHAHHHKNSAEEDSDIPCELPEQFLLDDLAHRTARAFVTEHADEIRCGMIPLSMYIFALMPFRHTAILSTVQLVQEHVTSMDELVQENGNMVRRFRKATNRRVAILQDETRREGDLYRNPEAGLFSDDDILECHPFQADLSNSRSHPVHQSICSFLASQDILPLSKGNTTVKASPLVVSLSGGVDSMVLAFVLSYLNKHCHYNLLISAVHIDYANRPESGAEAEYCRRFCDRLGIEFHVRRIDEVTRGVTERDVYERTTRQIRYDAYRQMVAAAKRKVPFASKEVVGVMLGHHRGDLRENVLSNAHKGCGPLDLSGMTAVSQNDGVLLFRPLLPLEKKDIYSYAHTYGVPYFKDTTPHWSTRGKLRNKLIPLLEEIYGEGSMNHLSDLAVESDECRALVHNLAFAPFFDQVIHKPIGITFATAPWKYQGLFFWKFVLREALHSASLGMFSDKMVITFLGRIQNDVVKEGWLQCRKDYAVYVREDGQIYILLPSSFPWRSEDEYKCKGQTVLLGSENAVQIGPWRVTARRQLYEVFESQAVQDRLTQKAIRSMDDFMEGSIEYYVESRTMHAKGGFFEPLPLIFTDFTKATRPRAWKNIDKKLEDKLPLLGNGEKALMALKDPAGCGAVHENQDGNIVENPIILIHVSLRLAQAFPMSP